MSPDLAITDREFELFKALILEQTGILLTDHKRPLLCSRLAKRLRRLELTSFSQYYEYLHTQDPRGEERRELVNSITTNKTEFFRESHHFDFLRARVLEPLARSAASGGERKLRVWSAACSSGEEPYSIAMTVADALQPLGAWDVRILASDIDTQVLERAALGRYPREAAERISPERRRRWCRRLGKEEFEIDPALRQLVTFRQINFVHEPWPIRARFDVIFCRNVMIYFGRDTQERIYTRFHQLLKPGGFLVAGHSENLLFMAHLFDAVGNTVYRRRSTGQSRRSLRPVLHPRASVSPRAAPERSPGRSPPSPPPARRRRASRRDVRGVGAARAAQHHGRVTLIPESDSRRRVSSRASAQPRSAPVPRSEAERKFGSLSSREPAPALVLAPATGDLPRSRIMSGELFASAEPAVVTTLLGSGVAACLFDLERGIGGMNHFMLPAGDGDHGHNPICFGTNAMELLINELLGLGARRDRLQAHAFGAAHVLTGARLQAQVSIQNARFVREFLACERIPLLEESLGGERPLMVSFETHSGRVSARVAGEDAAAVARAEAEFRARLARDLQPREDSVTLF